MTERQQILTALHWMISTALICELYSDNSIKIKTATSLNQEVLELAIAKVMCVGRKLGSWPASLWLLLVCATPSSIQFPSLRR